MIKHFAKFTDKELQYIYNYCDFDVDRPLFREIEKKIRRQIKKYREVDRSYAEHSGKGK